MIQSILDITLVIAYLAGFVINPWHREKRNGFALCAVGSMLLIFWVGLAAGVYALIGVPLTLVSINAAVALAALLVWLFVLIKKKITKPVWPKVDTIFLIIVVGFVLMCSVMQFGWKLNLTYGDIDPARYMNMAMTTIREQKISSTYLTTLINVWCMLVCEAVVLPIHLYKGMILSDILMHLLSVWMFYVLLARLNHGKGKLLNPILTILYFCGYQLYNLVYGSFFHWVDGILIIMFLIYIVWLLEEKCISNVEGILCSVLGLFGLLTCYPYFLIIVVPLFLPEVIVWCKNNIKTVSPKVILPALLALLALVALGWVFAGQRIGHSFAGVINGLLTEGLAYREPYMDFVFLLPVLLCYVGVIHRHKKENRMILRMCIMGLMFIGVWFWLMTQERMSMYYYYRMYYVLWLLAWLMVGHCINILMKERQKVMVTAYAIFYIGVAILSVAGVNEKLYHMNENLYLGEQPSSSLFPLYRMNYLSATTEKKTVLSDLEMELCNQVIDNYGDMQVPIIHSVYSNMQANWYEGITGVNNKNIRWDILNVSFWDMFYAMDYYDISYFAMFKSDVYYDMYKDILFDKLEVAYENKDTILFVRKDEQWVEKIEKTDCLTEIEKYFCYVVREGYRGQKVPLICEQGLSDKVKYYTIYTGMESYEYWDCFTPETFVPSTYILNNDEVEYIAVLKNSEMYRINKEYFDAQQIVYENDAGMILQHAGTGWMPSEQVK